ncbi:C40 family peptidase [Lichenifustis flavocetrariae]|uniref:NlpC/P60 family protein n=1 Tax=Lichenifustis flavocetrariae TaxID=2949735 RepID=A0AA42CH45_9HYPH|nr:NlpC/P60 family protein [Lichenifustis flavocetrariae]MCW6506889.1 NlpC/P60 family protein [Lichenifustis flavocetrariae]
MVALIDRWYDEKQLSPRERLVAVARWFLGTPYQFGAKSAKPLDGLALHKLRPTDCSGLVRAIYDEVFPEAGLASRKDLGAQALLTCRLFQDVESPDKGDIICWKTHVGIVADPGGRTMIHAPGEGKPVRIQDWKWMPANPTFRKWQDL